MENKELSFITPIGLAFTIFLGILTLLLPRRFAIVPILMAACYLTLGQQILVAGLHFTIIRILILVGFVRLVIRKEIHLIKFNTIDKTLVLWVVSSIIMYTLLWQTTGAFINRLGLAYNAIGIYFLSRFFIHDIREFFNIIKVLAILVVPLAIVMLIESKTGRNIFYAFGGIPEFSEIRGGLVRCQGPFRHPILAGTFGATAMPLFVALWWQDWRGKILFFLGVISATIITITSTSSGPAAAYIFAIIGLTMWFFRDNMRAVRWALLLSLIALHIVMKAPVWFLIARLGGVIGGGGWHRAELIDQAVKHFDEWWLMGTKVTAHWMPYALDIDLTRADITNQFIAQGVNGGLLTMVLFILLLVRSFQGVGKAISMEGQPIGIRIGLWTIGTSLLAHVVSFFSVSYFDQMNIFWYLLLATISISSNPQLAKTAVKS